MRGAADIEHARMAQGARHDLRDVVVKDHRAAVTVPPTDLPS
jgi:hypothetical protein